MYSPTQATPTEDSATQSSLINNCNPSNDGPRHKRTQTRRHILEDRFLYVTMLLFSPYLYPIVHLLLHAEVTDADTLRALTALSRPGALALAVHCLALDHGFLCTGGSSDDGSSNPGPSGFAPAIRSVAASSLVPRDWTSSDGTTFSCRYIFPGSASSPGRASGAPSAFHVAMMVMGRHLLIAARATDAAGHTSEVSTELDIERWTTTTAAGDSGVRSHESSAAPAPTPAAPAPPASPFAATAAAADHVLSLLRPLADPPSSGTFCSLLGDHVWTRLAPACAGALQQRVAAAPAAETARAVAAAAADSRASRPHYRDEDDDFDTGSGGSSSGPVFGIPRPLTGTRPGDFDRDLYPDFSSAVPGYAIGGGSGGMFGGGRGGGGGGMLVGPGHPMFGGGMGGVGPFGPGGGGVPGVPPGARFDPIVPGGVFPAGPGGGGGAGGGLRGGRGGGRGGRGGGPRRALPGEPAPDHLAPPPDVGDEPPPDIYW